ncbi:hypothetical protein PR048_017454 [Dryococelus australis]|uniref:Uncharacterized protein n=1 Tax=Dryococelus australis TaxID=614101 RepID=A0ABQ9H9J5_9NEOP|nr:hypothetical protein PR048_017454 [Dryococelus australis]
MHFLAASWELFESQTISNCFKKADFGEDTSTALLDVPDKYESAWKNVQDAMNVSCNFEDFVAADDNTATCRLQSVEDLCEELVRIVRKRRKKMRHPNKHVWRQWSILKS